MTRHPAESRRESPTVAKGRGPGSLGQSSSAGRARGLRLAGGHRNLTNFIARSLLETGGFRQRPHPQIG